MKNKKDTKTNTSVMRRYEYRIYPSEAQKDLFIRTFGCVRFVYNRLLDEKIDFYEKTRKMLVNTPAHLKEEFPWLAEVDSMALCNAQIALQSAFANFFRDKSVGFPRFKSKKKPVRTYTTNVVNGNVKIIRSAQSSKKKCWKLKLPKVGLVDIVYHRSIPETWTIKAVTIKMLPSGQFYASVLCDTNKTNPSTVKIKNVPDNCIVGLDYSMPELYVSSIMANSPVEAKNFFRKEEQKIAQERRKMSRMKKEGKNGHKQLVRIARLEQRVKDRRKDCLHKESRRIANAFDIVCVEDINMKNMAQSLRFGKSVNDNGWGMFRCMLEYKLAEKGGLLVKVARFYPSSKTCNVCGSINNELKLSDRSWMCENCGTHHDRDINAAINIRNEGLRILKAA